MTHATIVVPSRGGVRRLPRLLTALAEQTHPEWDAIVVLDGDVDGSQQVLARYRDLPVQAVVFDQHRGQVAALNAGFAAATGDVLIRADDDFEPDPSHVAAHVAAHADIECGVIGLPRNIAPAGPYMRAYGADADRRARMAAYGAPAAERWRYWGGNTSVRRDTYVRVGGFDDRYRGYGWEDVDFGYRLHTHGIPIRLVEDAEVKHHMAAVDTVQRVQRAFWSGQARSRFEQIHGTGTTGGGGAPTWWSRLTTLAGRTLDAERARHTAAMIDRVLPVLPPPVARKAVALVVESAATAGFRQGPDR